MGGESQKTVCRLPAMLVSLQSSSISAQQTGKTGELKAYKDATAALLASVQHAMPRAPTMPKAELLLCNA